MAAGFETTSNTLTTLCLQLAQNQDILLNLLEEVDDVVERFDGVVNHETIADMPYLDACLKVFKKNHQYTYMSNNASGLLGEFENFPSSCKK